MVSEPLVLAWLATSTSPLECGVARPRVLTLCSLYHNIPPPRRPDSESVRELLVARVGKRQEVP